VNEESYQFAATGKAEYPMVAPEGGKEPLRTEYSAFTMGSDHDVYQDSSFGIPAIYMNDWPDRYIHTNFDSAANIDPTKLKRAAFIGAASGYFLAAQQYVIRSLELERAEKLGRSAREVQRVSRAKDLDEKERQNAFERKCEYDVGALLAGDVPGQMTFESHAKQDPTEPCASWLADTLKKEANPMRNEKTDGGTVRRRASPKGPLVVFGYDYFAEHAKAAGIETPKLLSYEGLWGAGEEYAYEVLNFADGKRNAQEIRDAVSAEYGPVPLELVVEYLKALEKINVVMMVR
jgi:aminopeptidase YwaD